MSSARSRNALRLQLCQYHRTPELLAVVAYLEAELDRLKTELLAVSDQLAMWRLQGRAQGVQDTLTALTRSVQTTHNESPVDSTSRE